MLPDLFAAAARRAREAGFDGVELHYAHAYTMASFLSGPNTRDDGYGGSRAGRVRLPLEVFARVRAEVGADYAVGCRMLAEECSRGRQYGVEDACSMRRRARARRHGLHLAVPRRQVRRREAAQGRRGGVPVHRPERLRVHALVRIPTNADRSAAICNPQRLCAPPCASEGLATPIVVSGGIHSFEQAETALREGSGDIVGFARQALADPDWFRKVRAGRGAEVRRAYYTNYCEALDQRHREVTCELWDREGLDAPGVQLSSDGKRRLLAPPWQE